MPSPAKRPCRAAQSHTDCGSRKYGAAESEATNATAAIATVAKAKSHGGQSKIVHIRLKRRHHMSAMLTNDRETIHVTRLDATPGNRYII
jgi:hypothetical protein